MRTNLWIPVTVGLALGACGGSKQAPPPAILVNDPDAGPRGAAPPTPKEPPPADAAPKGDAATRADAAPAAPDAGTTKPVEVHGSVTLAVERHCGGAAPPRDEKPRPPAVAPRYKLYVESGGKKIATVTTDARGAFTVSLQPGEYCIVDSARADDATRASRTIEATCLEKWQRACDVTFRVPRAEPIEVALVKTCQHPCYVGPQPK